MLVISFLYVNCVPLRDYISFYNVTLERTSLLTSSVQYQSHTALMLVISFLYVNCVPLRDYISFYNVTLERTSLLTSSVQYQSHTALC